MLAWRRCLHTACAQLEAGEGEQALQGLAQPGRKGREGDRELVEFGDGTGRR